VKPRLIGLGTANPPLRITQDDAARTAAVYGPRTPEERRIHRVLYRRTGVSSRASVTLTADDGQPVPGPLLAAPRNDMDRGPGTRQRLEIYETEAPVLAALAARRALDDADVAPEEIDQLIVVTCTGFMAPGIDVFLVRELGLGSDTGRLQVGFMGCHGAFVGLRQAAALAGADPRSTVLVVAVELCSLHFQYGWDPQQVVANALFADGAAACVVRGPVASSGDGLRLNAHASWLDEGTEEAMTWRIGDHGFQMTLSASVPERIGRSLPGRLEPWLAAHGVGLGEVGSWAVHPGGPRVLTSVARALDLAPGTLDLSRKVLAEHGNMSSPTILFVLEALKAVDAPRPWVALAFGPGLTTEAVLLT